MLVRFKTCKQGKTTSHYFFRRCKAVLSNYLSEDELKKVRTIEELKSK
jgi:hypothetical protein